MKTRLVLGLTLVVALLLAAVMPAFASAPVVDNDWIDQSGGGLACSGEWVELTGQAHYLTITQSDATGYHYLEHSNLIMTGYGTESGAHYEMVQVGNDISIADADAAPSTGTIVTRSMLVGPGPDNRDIYYVTAHVTYDANGIARVDFSESSWGCN